MKNTLNKIKIDYSTYFLILLSLLAGYIKLMFIILIIVIVHELGHVFFFSLFKIDVDKVIIYPYGGVTFVNRKIHERIYKDILISLGGIIFQILLMGGFWLLYRYNIIVFSTYDMGINYSFMIMIFNILPIIPLDGSKLLLAILCKYVSFKKSYKIMIIVSVISLILFFLFNIVYKLNDVVIYVFLIFKLLEIIREFKYVMNRFYLERVMYNNYYNEIINDEDDISKLRIDKYYFFRENNGYVNEKDYIKRKRF